MCYWNHITLRGRPYDVVTQLREIPACKSPSLEVHLARGVTTSVPTYAPQPLVTRSGSISASRTMHADYPLGRGPLLGRICPSGSLKVARSVASPYLMHRYFVSWVSPYWYWEYGFGATFLFYYYSSEARGPHAPTVLHPTWPPHPRSLLPVGIGGWPYPTVGTSWLEPSQHQRPVNARGRSTPETWSSPFSSHCAPDGSHQVLTLVNARGRVDTQAPQSSAENTIFSEKTKASPFCPTWHSSDGTFLRHDVTL